MERKRELEEVPIGSAGQELIRLPSSLPPCNQTSTQLPRPSHRPTISGVQKAP